MLKRVFLLFSLGIVGPALLLGFLGLRSFHYERELLREQNARRHESSAVEIQFAGQRVVKETINSLAIQGQPLLTRKGKTYFLIRQAADIPLTAVYQFDDKGNILFPSLTASLLAPVSDLAWGPLEEELRNLEKMEFKDVKIEEAATGYLKLAKEVSDSQKKVVLLKNAAAAFRKIKRQEEAKRIYEDIRLQYGQVLDVTGEPAGFVGGLRLADLFETNHQAASADAIRIELAEQLLAGTWDLNPADQIKLFQKLRGHSLSENNARWLQLDSRERAYRQLAQDADRYLKTSWPSVFQTLTGSGWRDSGAIIDAKKTGTFSVVAPLVSSAGENRRQFLVGIIQVDKLLGKLQDEIQAAAKTSGLPVIDIKPAPSNSVSTGLSKRLNNISPPLEIRFDPPAVDPQVILLKRRVRIYGAMSILSILVTIAGLGLMFFAIRREKENADLKAEFVSNVSHELRTPLSSISYIAERLRLGQFKSPDQANEFYGMLGEEATHLTGMVEEILDFSRMMSGKGSFELQKEDLVEVVQGAVDRYRTKAMAEGFSIKGNIPSKSLLVFVDRKALMKAIMNLLDNALKYSGSAKQIEVTVTDDANEARVSVADQGIGISKGEQSKIFEKFYRVESAMKRTSAGGIGLGLAMVKHIVEEHHGRIELESADNAGSKFTIVLPLEK